MDMFYVKSLKFSDKSNRQIFKHEESLTFSIKMRGFEIVKDPEAYSEPCLSSKMEIFKK